MEIEINGNRISLPDFIGRPGGGFIFALHKGGSVMLNNAASILTQGSNLDFFSLSNFLHGRDVRLPSTTFPEHTQKLLRQYLSQTGVIFGGWRQYPLNLGLTISPSTKSFLLVRDPRDILTSYYFYLKHAAPLTGPKAAEIADFRSAGDDGIDDFVLNQAEDFLGRYRSYNALIDSPGLMMRRYEDILFDKDALLNDLQSHFTIDAKPKRLERALDSMGDIPSHEDTAAHIRQAKPGDHARKLKADTINRLNIVFSDVLARYGYDRA